MELSNLWNLVLRAECAALPLPLPPRRCATRRARGGGGAPGCAGLTCWQSSPWLTLHVPQSSQTAAVMPMRTNAPAQSAQASLPPQTPQLSRTTARLAALKQRGTTF